MSLFQKIQILDDRENKKFSLKVDGKEIKRVAGYSVEAKAGYVTEIKFTLLAWPDELELEINDIAEIEKEILPREGTEMNVELIAKICHNVNKAYCESTGDFSQPKWGEAPDWQKESAVNGVEFHLATDRTPRDSHDNWMADKINDGWVYGEIKNPEKKTHPCLVPYEELPLEQRTKDYLFKAVVDSFK